MQYLGPGIDFSHGRFQCIGVARLVAAVNKNNLGALETGQRLAQRTLGKEPVGGQRLCAIDHYNIEVTVQFSMLKTVVQNEDCIGSLLEDSFSRSPSVFRY